MKHNFNDRVYLRNVSRRWRAEADSAESIDVFFPYITLPTSETVLKGVTATECRVFTVFSAENFVNGSSSIKALMKLADTGVRLFHLPDLHAKIFCTDEMLTIGSQNLTSRGTRSLEATVVLNGKDHHLSRQALAAWAEQAVPITEDMLEEMERLVRPLLKDYRLLQSKSEEIDKELEHLVLAQDSTIDAVRTQSRKNWKTLASPKVEIRAHIAELETGEHGWTSTSSLVPNLDRNLQRWVLGGRVVQLKRLYRYLMYDIHTGNIGWARVAKTRITFFGSGVDWTDSVSILGHRWILSFQGLRDRNSGRNLEVTMKSGRFRESSLTFEAVFDLTSIRNLVISDDNAYPLQDMQDLESAVIAQSEALTEPLLRFLTEPFKYSANLNGVQANKFFETDQNSILLRITKVGGHPIFVADRDIA